MKKIMSLLLGMSLVLGTASFAFAQDPNKSDDKSKTKKKKNPKKKDKMDKMDKKS